MPSILLAFVHRLIGSRRGAAAIEYSVIVALIAVAIAAALNFTGQSVQGVLGTAGNAMN